MKKDPRHVLFKKTGEKDTKGNLSSIPPIAADEEEAKEGREIKILAPRKLLTRPPILLARIKAGNNSYKLKNGIRQIVYLLYQHNKITKKH